MGVWAIRCGTCGYGVSAEVVAGWPLGRVPAQQMAAAAEATLWLRCPNCGEGSVKLRDGSVYPTAPAGARVKGLPDDVERAWREARITHSVGAYTASEIMCRKILMHVAVDVAKSDEGKRFVAYVEDLGAAGYITKGLEPVVDQVRRRGNIANHDLPASTEQDSLVTLQITEHLLRSIYELPGLAEN